MYNGLDSNFHVRKALPKRYSEERGNFKGTLSVHTFMSDKAHPKTIRKIGSFLNDPIRSHYAMYNGLDSNFHARKALPKRLSEERGNFEATLSVHTFMSDKAHPKTI